jgi:Protein of unknown function (DUF3047)
VRTLRPTIALFATVAGLWCGADRVYAQIYMIRFSDIPSLQSQSSQQRQPFRLLSPTPTPDLPPVPAADWLKQNDWKRVWPWFKTNEDDTLQFAGPRTERYLQIKATDDFFVWSHELDLDPQQWPILEITWSVDRFPDEAAMDVYGRNDRPIAVFVAFGPKLPATKKLRPAAPRSLAFFWDETATTGTNYTCISPRNGPRDVQLQCTYPHIKFIALRSGNAGTPRTDQINLVEQFQRQFPDYWEEHQRVPPIVGIAFESRTELTKSTSHARLYALTFMTKRALSAPAALHIQKGMSNGTR